MLLLWYILQTSPPDDTTATEDEEALKKEMLLLPNNVGLRRINDMMKRAKLVKVSSTISCTAFWYFICH
jgi:hypothetical protein